MPTTLDLFATPLDGINLIEASAGTGKTWTICGLYVRLLLETPRTVPEILVVTFTKAATVEIRDRIRNRLVDLERALEGGAAGDADPFVVEYLLRLDGGQIAGLDAQGALARIKRALSELDEVSVFTIHGFCQRALAEVPFAAGLPFSVEALEDDEEFLLGVATDFFRSRIATDAIGPHVASLLRGQVTPASLAAVLKQRLAKPLAHYEFAFTSDPASLDRYVETYLQARVLWRAESKGIVQCVIDGLSALNGRSYNAERVSASALVWDEFFQAPFAHFPYDQKTRWEKCQYLRRGHLEKQRKGPIPEHAFFHLAQALWDRQDSARQALGAIHLSLLQELIDQSPGKVREEKRRRRVIGFDDMLYNLHAALKNPELGWLAGALRSRYPTALIDEFQDTDPLQLAIFSAIYHGGTHAGPLFLVGDPKQAIYGFRNADLYAYLQATDLARERRSTLTTSQRSVPRLLVALNGLFSVHDNAFLLEKLRYHELEPSRRAKTALLDPRADAALVLWMLPRDEDGIPIGKTEAEERVVRATCAEIARLLGDARAGKVRIGERELAAGDIAVIVRTHRQGRAVKRALQALGIGCVERSRESVFAGAEAKSFLHFLAAVSNPTQDKALCAALSSDLFGLDANQIDEGSRDEGRLAERLLRFADYRGLWERHGFARMWRELMDDTRLVARLLGEPDGERKITNYFHLGELIHAASARHRGIDALLRWFTDTCARAEQTEEAQLRLESDERLAQIITVHAAKGLEYPVTFCPFFWIGGSRVENAASCATYHDERGQAVTRYSLDNGEAIRRERLEELAENLRLIYVALTRAVHRAYLVAGTYSHRKDRGKTSRASALNWLIAGGGVTAEDWHDGKGPDLPAIEAAWQGFATRHARVVSFCTLPETVPRRPPARYDAVPALSAEQTTRVLDESWRLASFTSLNQAQDLAAPARFEAPPTDYDEGVGATEEDARDVPGSLPEDDMLRFPRGAEPGTLLHAAFEYADFTRPEAWDAAIVRALARHPVAIPPKDAPGSHDLLRRMLRAALANAGSTDLDSRGLRLCMIPHAERLSELGFSFRAGPIRLEALGELLAQADVPVPRLQGGALCGYLRGAIDCVFRHRGRFYLADWKSNYLGAAQRHYTDEALARAMEDEGYHLQYALYSLALHRYLRRRLRDYDYKRHFGGAYYLFVRGLRSGWRQRDGRPAGVFFARLEVQAIAALDALFDGRARERAHER